MSNTTEAAAATTTATTVWLTMYDGDGVPSVHWTEEGARREAERWATHIFTQTGWRPHVWVVGMEVGS